MVALTAYDWRYIWPSLALFANVVPPRQCKRCDRSFEAHTDGYDTLLATEDSQSPLQHNLVP